ncbi:hypothetical protein PGIGA_G00222100 [Pangasianodon gigas]|uniref:Uncharacterized protein n=1 Tax=Pangasianodon gigas TaxID=30993 RepID=A0ACC5WJV0_PANGG|nr:hypothetical protein [Pangasianodon gigas]
MYLYKATCAEIPNLKPKGIQKSSGDRAQTRISRDNSVDKAYPFMCWSGLRTNTHLELKHLEEFLNTHAVSLQDSVPTVTGMVYSKRFILVRVLVDPELIVGTLGMRQKYTLDRMPVHRRASNI